MRWRSSCDVGDPRAGRTVPADGADSGRRRWRPDLATARAQGAPAPRLPPSLPPTCGQSVPARCAHRSRSRAGCGRPPGRNEAHSPAATRSPGTGGSSSPANRWATAATGSHRGTDGLRGQSPSARCSSQGAELSPVSNVITVRVVARHRPTCVERPERDQLPETTISRTAAHRGRRAELPTPHGHDPQPDAHRRLAMEHREQAMGASPDALGHGQRVHTSRQSRRMSQGREPQARGRGAAGPADQGPHHVRRS